MRNGCNGRSDRNSWSGWARATAMALLALSSCFGSFTVLGKESAAVLGQSIALNQLPAQGQTVMGLIYQGGPFKYDKDGTVFGNREKLLPNRQRGYYREYTVKTPGERSRGARRIVCGGLQPRAPDACFYTDDHYASFRQIVR